MFLFERSMTAFNKKGISWNHEALPPSGTTDCYVFSQNQRCPLSYCSSTSVKNLVSAGQCADPTP